MKTYREESKQSRIELEAAQLLNDASEDEQEQSEPLPAMQSLVEKHLEQQTREQDPQMQEDSVRCRFQQIDVGK